MIKMWILFFFLRKCTYLPPSLSLETALKQHGVTNNKHNRNDVMVSLSQIKPWQTSSCSVRVPLIPKQVQNKRKVTILEIYCWINLRYPLIISKKTKLHVRVWLRGKSKLTTVNRSKFMSHRVIRRAGWLQHKYGFLFCCNSFSIPLSLRAHCVRENLKKSRVNYNVIWCY